MWFRVGDNEFEAPEGSCIFRPKGVPHTLWNATREVAVQLEITNPGERLERCFAAFAKLPEGSSVEQMRELGNAHGITYFDELIPEIEACHDVSVNGGLWTELP